MDKQLLKAYIRTIVEEEVSRILPQMLSEAVSEIKQLKEKILQANTEKINTLETSLQDQNQKIKKITQRLDYIKAQIEKK